jgi:hypothetical protein
MELFLLVEQHANLKQPQLQLKSLDAELKQKPVIWIHPTAVMV